ncbi:prenyltransferase and squalene oxidase repeat-containing protein [Besnoitia besnoiti]|uniref:Geranylgeranyl transferase type II subunit beta n=1 Tax=Besnoitia besnoiti TaxID=94643 RepID=A0A2A9M7L5_BESBE|nr:prenyltransferase and squalene oxidase repeat-containing protein [Besnoitia besnoiti]PFH31352.1 prenyltransferase and squalene oxidase repeat-containing protein [Besnoitia besnoiti]
MTVDPNTLQAARHRRFLEAILVAGLKSASRARLPPAAEEDPQLEAIASFCKSHDPFGDDGALADATSSLEAESFLLSGVYWTLAGLSVLGSEAEQADAGSEGEPRSLVAEVQRSQLLELVLKCKRCIPCNRHAEGGVVCSASMSSAEGEPECSACCVGFAPNPDPSYPATSLSTLSALQILVLLDNTDSSVLPRRLLAQIQRFLIRLQDPASGAFKNRVAGYPDGPAEPDMRFAMCAIASFRLTQLILYHNERAGRTADSPELDASRALRGGKDTRQAEAGSCKEDGAVEQTPRDGGPLGTKWVAADTAGPVAHDTQNPVLRNYIDISQLFKWLMLCQNLDGGFGCFPGCESHGGTTFCAVACLGLMGLLLRLPAPARLSLEGWLSERQALSGGLNGRPGKDADSCYCWWILASAKILGMDLASVYDTQRLQNFVLSCQAPCGGVSRAEQSRARRLGKEHRNRKQTDEAAQEQAPDGAEAPEAGADAQREHEELDDRPANSLFGRGRMEGFPSSKREPDPFHTFFGLAGLSILVKEMHISQVDQQTAEDYSILARRLATVHPLFGLPCSCLKRYNI